MIVCAQLSLSSGVYVQGADPGSSHAAVAVRDDTQVVASTLKPLDMFHQTSDSHRYVWHILPEPGAKQIKLWNELNLTPLTHVNTGHEGGTTCIPDNSSTNAVFSLEPLPNAAGYSLNSVVTRTPLSAGRIMSDLSGSCLASFQNPASVPLSKAQETAKLWASYRFKTWTFVPITSFLSGPLVTMSKCLLGPGSLQDLDSVESMKNQILMDSGPVQQNKTRIAPYKPGQAATRFRVANYGSIFLLISDSSRRAVSSTTHETVDLSQVVDASHWFTITNNQIVSLADSQPKFWQIVVGIDDIAERLKPWYIILGHSDDTGYPIVLSVAGQGQAVIATPYDPYDANQLWKYYDWGSSK